MSDLSIHPLRELHEQDGAEFQPYADREVVSTFGNVPAEYAAIRKGCALIDLPQRGVVELTGKDRLDFLNRFLTNKTIDKETKAPLAAGAGVYAFLLNGKGRIVADMNVLERGDRTWLETDARLIEMLRTTFEKYLFTEQVKLAARHDLFEIALHGPASTAVLDGAFGPAEGSIPASAIGVLGSSAGIIADAAILIWRDDPAGVPGFHIITTADHVGKIWTMLRQISGVRPAGWAAFNSTRIEAGRPLFGIDFDETVLPAETGQLGRAVSFTKGCYLGQEIVARMHARGQLARQLIGLRLGDDHLPLAGSHLFDDKGNQIGGVTSSTISPILSGVAIALGYGKKPFAAPGTVVTVPAEGAMRQAKVVELPFIKR